MLCLQPQKNTLPLFSAVYFSGLNSVPLCDPSQKGCLLDLPQAHQKYDLPSVTSTTNGANWAIVGGDDMAWGAPWLVTSFSALPDYQHRSSLWLVTAALSRQSGRMKYFLNRLKYRTVWSWAGCRDAWINEHSFRTWVWANLVSAGFALWLPLETGERALILALGVLVLAAELFNRDVKSAC